MMYGVGFCLVEEIINPIRKWLFSSMMFMITLQELVCTLGPVISLVERFHSLVRLMFKFLIQELAKQLQCES